MRFWDTVSGGAFPGVKFYFIAIGPTPRFIDGDQYITIGMHRNTYCEQVLRPEGLLSHW